MPRGDPLPRGATALRSRRNGRIARPPAQSCPRREGGRRPRFLGSRVDPRSAAGPPQLSFPRSPLSTLTQGGNTKVAANIPGAAAIVAARRWLDSATKSPEPGAPGHGPLSTAAVGRGCRARRAAGREGPRPQRTPRGPENSTVAAPWSRFTNTLVSSRAVGAWFSAHRGPGAPGRRSGRAIWPLSGGRPNRSRWGSEDTHLRVLPRPHPIGRDPCNRFPPWSRKYSAGAPPERSAAHSLRSLDPTPHRDRRERRRRRTEPAIRARRASTRRSHGRTAPPPRPLSRR